MMQGTIKHWTSVQGPHRAWGNTQLSSGEPAHCQLRTATCTPAYAGPECFQPPYNLLHVLAGQGGRQILPQRKSKASEVQTPGRPGCAAAHDCPQKAGKSRQSGLEGGGRGRRRRRSAGRGKGRRYACLITSPWPAPCSWRAASPARCRTAWGWHHPGAHRSRPPAAPPPPPSPRARPRSRRVPSPLLAPPPAPPAARARPARRNRPRRLFVRDARNPKNLARARPPPAATRPYFSPTPRYARLRGPTQPHSAHHGLGVRKVGKAPAGTERTEKGKQHRAGIVAVAPLNAQREGSSPQRMRGRTAPTCGGPRWAVLAVGWARCPGALGGASANGGWPLPCPTRPSGQRHFFQGMSAGQHTLKLRRYRKEMSVLYSDSAKIARDFRVCRSVLI